MVYVNNINLNYSNVFLREDEASKHDLRLS